MVFMWTGRYTYMFARLRKRPFYVHVDLKTWKDSANSSCRILRERLCRRYYLI